MTGVGDPKRLACQPKLITGDKPAFAQGYGGQPSLESRAKVGGAARI